MAFKLATCACTSTRPVLVWRALGWARRARPSKRVRARCRALRRRDRGVGHEEATRSRRRRLREGSHRRALAPDSKIYTIFERHLGDQRLVISRANLGYISSNAVRAFAIADCGAATNRRTPCMVLRVAISETPMRPAPRTRHRRAGDGRWGPIGRYTFQQVDVVGVHQARPRYRQCQTEHVGYVVSGSLHVTHETQ